MTSTPGLSRLLLILGLVVGAIASDARPNGEITAGEAAGAVPPLTAAYGAPLARVAKVPATGAARRKARVLTNGCRYTRRGIPRCGALLGAAYGSNSRPAVWERHSLRRGLGVHRTYWGADDVGSAVRQARWDVLSNRIGWLSFKLPYSWRAMAAGRGDAWVRDLSRRLAKVPGPAWVAFHHEPEGDGDIRDWTRMQARLAPIVRRNAPNVAYSIVLTGWNQLYGPRQYRLARMWPHRTVVDLAGFDVYNKHGVVKNGRRFTTRTDFVNQYFRYFRGFARRHRMAWGLAETGQSDWAAPRDPAWVGRTYRQMRAYGGVAFSYFNTRLNSNASWLLRGAKERRFARALRSSPTL